jgi:hypothetical protein
MALEPSPNGGLKRNVRQAVWLDSLDPVPLPSSDWLMLSALGGLA